MQEQEEPCPEGQHRNDAGECVPDVQEQDEACPEGQHRNEDGECVPDEPVEETDEGVVQDETNCPEGTHWDEATMTCIPDMVEPVAVETTTPDAITIDALTLGEPFADYDSMEDCIAKNQDKEDPAGYCASIQNQAEPAQETRVLAATSNDVKHLKRLFAKEQLEHRHQHDDIQESIAKFNNALDCNNTSFTAIRTGIQSLRKQQRRIAHKLNEVIHSMPQPVDVTPIVEQVNDRFATFHTQMHRMALTTASTQKTTQKSLRSFSHQLANLKESIPDTVQLHAEVASSVTTMLNDLKAELESKLQEAIDAYRADVTKQLEETTHNKLKETETIVTRLDNLTDMVKSLSQFKAPNKTLQENKDTGPDAKRPWEEAN
jgi:archaellum component FlaC